MRPLRLLSLLLLAAGLLSQPCAALAFSPTTTSFYLPPSALATEGVFGASISGNQFYTVVGDPGDTKAGANAGAAHVFDTRTARYLRRLSPLDPTAGGEFGVSVAVAGPYVLVGAPGQEAAYVFDLRTGRQLFRLTASNGTAGARFGNVVAASLRWFVVGAPQQASNRGEVYAFDLASLDNGNLDETQMVGTDSAAGHYLGSSVSVSGDLVLAGAVGVSSLRGAAYLFEAPSGVQLQKLTASDAAANHGFGVTVSLSGDRALVGSSVGDGAYFFDLPNFTQTKYTSSLPTFFGNAAALDGRLAAVFTRVINALTLVDTATGNSLADLYLPGNQSLHFVNNMAFYSNPTRLNRDGVAVGAGYVTKFISGPLPLASAAASGGAALGAEDSSFGSFGSFVLDPDGSFAFQSRLKGAGSNRGRDSGVWGLADAVAVSRQSLETRLGTGNGFDGIRVGAVGNPIRNERYNALFLASLTGTGVNKTNHLALFAGSFGNTFRPLLRTGTTMLAGGRVIASLPDFVQNRGLGLTGEGRFAAAHTLRRGPGGVTATNDSGVLFANSQPMAVVRDFAREGDTFAAMGGGTWGQFFGRVTCAVEEEYGFGAWWVPTGETTPIQGLFSDNQAGSGKNAERQGAAASGWPGLNYGAFLGETMNTGGWLVFRASLTGVGVNKTNNEGLRHANAGPVLRKSEVIEAGHGLPAAAIAGFLGYWPVSDDAVVADAALVLVKLAGRGINRNNDCALLLWRDGEDLKVLLREGQPAFEADGARIGVIQRVDVDPVAGEYVILASLTGDASRNQALFTGHALADDEALRVPMPRLRKGYLHGSPVGAVTGIRSMSLPTTTDRGGAGGKGGAQVVNHRGHVAVQIQFDNRAVELMIGAP